MQTTRDQSRAFLGFILIAPYFVALAALSNFGAGGTFESVVIFGLIGVISLIGALWAKQQGLQPFKWFDGKLNSQDAKLIAIGYVALLGAAYLITPYFGAVGILIALGVGGGILAFVLIKSENILVPIIVHGLYNLTAIALASLSVIPLAASPIFVPDFSVGTAQTNTILSQAFLQVFVVAFSEELMKVSLALGFSLFITKDKKVTFAIAVVLWTVLHSVLSYRIF